MQMQNEIGERAQGYDHQEDPERKPHWWHANMEQPARFGAVPFGLQIRQLNLDRVPYSVQDFVEQLSPYFDQLGVSFDLQS